MTAEEFKIELLPFKNKLFRFAMRFLNNREEAEDVVQDIYLKVWEMKSDFWKYNSKEALLMTMIRNKSLDKLKAKKNKALSLHAFSNTSNHTDILVNTEHKDLVQHVRNIMETLPEQQKTILHLRDIEGMEFEEISEITGFTPNYLRVNLSRARKKVKESLQKIEAYEIG